MVSISIACPGLKVKTLKYKACFSLTYHHRMRALSEVNQDLQKERMQLKLIGSVQQTGNLKIGLFHLSYLCGLLYKLSLNIIVLCSNHKAFR